MRTHLLIATALVAVTAPAQSYFVPDNVATSGGCNVIPFGSTSLTTWGTQRYQTKATTADLGGLPGLITGIAFAPCSSGQIHFDALEVILDHHPAGAPMSTTFASNLTANAVTVLAVTDHTWRKPAANVWLEIGLQNYFVYNGTDDLIIQVTTTNGLTTGASSAGFRTGARQRLYHYSTAGPINATGTLGSSAALKWEISELTARLSTYGVGCAGTNGVPVHDLNGSSQLGQTVNLDLTNGVANGFAFLAMGFYNGLPFPLDLSGLGMPGCVQYQDVVANQFVLLDTAGAGSVPFAIPNDVNLVGVLLFSQYACVDAAANATGITTSNYGRIFIGN